MHIDFIALPRPNKDYQYPRNVCGADKREGRKEERGWVAGGPYPTFIEAFILDSQALPEQENTVILCKDLNGFRCWQRN